MISLNQKNYVKEAEDVISNLKRNNNNNNNNKIYLTTSQLRNVLAKVSSIYIDVNQNRNAVLTDKNQADIQYLKLQIVYASGRDEKGNVRDFVEKSKILKYIDEIGDSKEDFLLFARYMEALVAYHKFQGGQE